MRGFLGETPPVHSLGELAAMSWLAERLTMAGVIAEPAARVLAVDFEDLLSNTEGTLARVTQHFGLAIDDATLRAMARTVPYLPKNSKGPEYEYSPQFRAEILAQSRRENAIEIGAGLAWLGSIASRNVRITALME